VKLLLQRGASVTALSSSGSSAMSQAVRFGHLNVVALLLEFNPIVYYGKPHRKSEPLLLTAAAEGHSEIGLLLLTHLSGAVNMRDKYGYTALHKAVTGQHKDFIERVLLPHQVDLNIADEVYNETALMKACKLGYAEIARLLLSQEGIDVTAKNRSGATALTMIRTTYEDIRVMLTEASAKCTKKSKSKPPPPAAAIKMTAMESVKSQNLGHLSVVKFPDPSTSETTSLKKRSGPMLCENDELAALQRDEMEACSGIFGDDFQILREPPAEGGRPTGCASVKLLCMDHFKSNTAATWAGKICLHFEMGARYPSDYSEVFLAVQLCGLSLLECPSHLCDELEKRLYEVLPNSDGLFGCVHAANEWLESEQWRYPPVPSSSSLSAVRAQTAWVAPQNSMYYDSDEEEVMDRRATLTISTKLAKEIVKARNARRMTQAELAGKVYVRKQIIQEYEAGNAIADFAVLKRIKRELAIL